nr:GtrA family protein [uncultured Pedobacter sp.]
MDSEITNETDYLYKIINNKVVRFFLSAGIATLIDVFIYFIVINYVFHYRRVNIAGHTSSAHNLALCISYSCGVVINFLLTKYAVFNESNIAGRKQFRRFALIAFIGFFANYGLLRLFVEVFGFNPTPSRVASALSLGVASYYIHKLFTFKIK